MSGAQSKNQQPHRIKINAIPGLSGFKLSKMVNEIDFRRPNSRGQLRTGATTKAVLRALCDRYPNVWASVSTDAKKVGISARQFQYELRRLEKLYRLIVPIGNNRGGHHRNTTQYFILDRKIMNIVQTKRFFEHWERVQSQQSVSHIPNAGTGAISDKDGCNLRHENGGTGAMPCTQTEQVLREQEKREERETLPSEIEKSGSAPAAQEGQGKPDSDLAAFISKLPIEYNCKSYSFTREQQQRLFALAGKYGARYVVSAHRNYGWEDDKPSFNTPKFVDGCEARILAELDQEKKQRRQAEIAERQAEHLRQEAAIEQAELEERLAAAIELQNEALAELVST